MATTEIYRYLPVSDTTSVALDPEGYLVELEQWTPDVARALAAEEGIALDEAHWEVIEVLRDFYARYEMAPAMRPWSRPWGVPWGRKRGVRSI
ncbi:sulfurtransferase TusE [Halomonas elongata]|uniref:Sulfurtransferase TusE n=1 Tax=Halomonas elongata TaxID=2746 RepID=A0A1B8P261_HALEL|nr:sulfurtransferase TusE [Halomonas elongata]